MIEIQCDIFLFYGMAILLSVSIPILLSVVTKLKDSDRGSDNIVQVLRGHIYSKRGCMIYYFRPGWRHCQNQLFYCANSVQINIFSCSCLWKLRLSM